MHQQDDILAGVAGGFACRVNGFDVWFEARDRLAANGFEVNQFGGVAGCFEELTYRRVACTGVPGTRNENYRGLDLRHGVDGDLKC